MTTNTAAWILSKRADLAVQPASYIPPGDNEIVVKNHAIAINPLDWILQNAGELVFSWIRYPFILGSDLAGEVVEVGKNVSRFKVGQRVLAHAVGSDPKRNRAAEGAFQNYTVVLEHMAYAIPDSMSYESAAVLPLGLSTAACGLFEKDQMALLHPSATAKQAKATGQTVLVWGGSTSVGCNAIQLAVAAGYEVIATASAKNFDYLRKLGASQVFDYRSDSVVTDIIQACNGKILAGAMAIGMGSMEACLDIVHACKGNKFVAMATFPVSFQKMTKGTNLKLQFLLQLPRLVAFMLSMQIKSRLRGIRTKAIFGTSLIANEVSQLIYRDFLPAALAQGIFVAAPSPHVIGKGLEYVQAGLDMQRKGVSASKIVISL
ncbi:zinc-binding alcohol dehydrogenase family protein [Undibacterium sp. Tian12W]|uniref:zinc-binding alcohol dehydrogenase family protein n=1 Tax=Undibacterium sp. Tian12W TaxID=3413054 RepID=UPI003BF428C2